MSGERAELKKQQPAIALKISLTGLVQNKIFFQDIGFVNEFRLLLSKLMERENYLQKTGFFGEKLGDALIKSEEFLNVAGFLENKFFWRKGKYDVHLHVKEASLKEPHIEYFRFELSELDADRLKNNIEFAKEELKNYILYQGKPSDERPPKPVYQWINPNFYKIERQRYKNTNREQKWKR